MLHGIKNEQGNCLDVRDDISENDIIFDIFHMFSYKSIASVAIILGIIVIAINMPNGLVLQMLYMIFLSHIS